MRKSYIFRTHPTDWWWPTLVGRVQFFKTDWLILCTSHWRDSSTQSTYTTSSLHLHRIHNVLLDTLCIMWLYRETQTPVTFNVRSLPGFSYICREHIHDSFSEPAKQNYHRANFIFTNQHYYYFSLWFLNICSYLYFIINTLKWVHPHLLYTLTQSYTLIYIYTQIHTILHNYPSFISSYTHTSSHPLTHSLTHIVSHTRLYTITHSSKILIYLLNH